MIILLGIILTSCASSNKKVNTYKGDLPYVEGTPTSELLESIPDLDNQPKITIAVYAFTDKTGQRKPSTKFSQLSTAVTQGSDAYVIQALRMVSGGDWFQVVERNGLDNLVKERQLIRSTRDLYDGETEIGNILKPLLFAGLLIEGGIVGYDSNIQSGGAGARYFGIGMSEQYRVDQVTVSMRIVSVQTGEVLLSTNVTKTIASHSSGGDVFRFLDLGTKALELETGVAVNEPVNYAIRTAIEFAVLQLIYAGEKQEFWKFKNPNVDIHPHDKTNTEINGVHK
jgi:curli production assembly/transport component CsgG